MSSTAEIFSSPEMSESLPENITASAEFFFWLDKRGGWMKRVRRVRLTGACVSRTAKNAVAIRARIRDRVFDGIVAGTRPEVLQALGLPLTSASQGFQIDALFPFGKHDLSIELLDSDQQWHTVLKRKVRGPLIPGAVDAREWRDVQYQEARRRYISATDLPQPWSPPLGQSHISGWCVDTAGSRIEAIRGRIGRRTFPAVFGVPRPDLAETYPNLRVTARAVFGIALHVPASASQLSLELRQSEGGWREFYRRRIAPATPPSPPRDLPRGIDFQAGSQQRSRFEFWFDRPADWSKRRRYLHISGWCFAGEGPQIAALRARIGRQIFPARYGIVRPDVAARLQGMAGSARSGFYVDVIVPMGNPKLVLEAQSEKGEWAPFYSRRIKGPLLARRYDDVQETIGNYSSWIRAYDTLSRSDRRQIRSHIRDLTEQPLISVLLPAFNTDAQWLRRAIDSVRKQLYPKWELCIVDDGSTAGHVWPLIERYVRSDPRIKARRLAATSHISAASNAAFELACGQFIAFLDHDDELAETALYFVAVELAHNPGLRLIYTDEDKLDAQGRRCDPHFKTDWNPDLFYGQNFVSHLSIISADLMRAVGGFRVGCEGAQDYDLLLRCLEQLKSPEIRHIPRVLYHWRCSSESTASFADNKPYAHEAARRAVAEHLTRIGQTGAGVHSHRRIYRRVKYPPPPQEPLVSIIIPTRDQLAFLRRCLDTILSVTSYRNFEVVVMDNGSSKAPTIDFFNELSSRRLARILRVDAPFNYSRLNNLGVAQARGEYLALLNNDLEVTHPDWLTEMVSQAARPEIGAVGACLRYPDGRIQHGGVILGMKGIGAHAHAGLIDEDGYFSRPHLVQNFSAVTAACLVMRKAVYTQVGGLDETHLTVAFNDVDLCLRIQQIGLRVLWTPFAELRHYESTSRGQEDTLAKQQRFAAEVHYMTDHWHDKLQNDPFYNPNLALDKELFSLAFPPRLQKPWEKTAGRN